MMKCYEALALYSVVVKFRAAFAGVAVEYSRVEQIVVFL